MLAALDRLKAGLTALLPGRAAAPAVTEPEAPPASQQDALDHLLRIRKACLLPLPTMTLPDDTTMTVRACYPALIE